MPFLAFVIAWLGLLVIFISTGGKPEANSLATTLWWLCMIVVVVCGLYTMFTVSFWGGVAMIGSLHFFAVKKRKDGQ